MIKERPSITTSELRPYISEYLPHFKGVDSDIALSIRRRVLNFFNTNGWNAGLDVKSSLEMIKYKGAAYENLKTDDPLICKNLAAMFRKIMAQSSQLWKAEQYAKLLKEQIVGFDYKIRLDSDGEPDAIMWMMPHNKKVLRRYPEVLSLDMQKVQYNKYNWPYCSLIFHGGENIGEQGCECIVCEESIDMYHWIITSCVELEPQFDISKIRVIFADNLITDELLHKLEIHTSCFLHCDYYHQMQTVWPAYFKNIFQNIKPWLEMIITSKTEDQFNRGCADIYSKIADYDKGMADTFVNDLKQKATYYGGYYLHKVTGLMDVSTSVEVEQNHSGNHAYLGNGDNMTIERQMKLHIERSQNRLRLRKEKECKWEHSLNNNKSSEFVGKMKIADGNARKNLTQWAYNKLWRKQAKATKPLLVEKRSDGTTLFWHNSKDKNDPNNWHIVQNGCRCTCKHRLTHWIQCKHEIIIDETFVVDKWASRYYNDTTYTNLVDAKTTEESDESHNEVVEGDFAVYNVQDGTDSDHSSSPITKKDLGNMYNKTMARCQEMCRLFQNDDKALCRILSHINDIIANERAGRKVNYHLSVDTLGSVHKSGPKASCTRSNRTACFQKRKKPFTEVITKKIAGPTFKNSRLTTKTCLICGTKGHGKLKCPLMQNDKGLAPVSKFDKENALITKLTGDQYYHTELLKSMPKSIYKSYNTKVCGLCIHGRYRFENNVLFKCSVYREKDPEGPVVKNEFFTLHVVTKLISKNIQTIVINEMDEILDLSQEATNKENIVNNIVNLSQEATLNNRSQFPETTMWRNIQIDNQINNIIRPVSTYPTSNINAKRISNTLIPQRNLGVNNLITQFDTYPTTYANIPTNNANVSYHSGRDSYTQDYYTQDSYTQDI